MTTPIPDTRPGVIKDDDHGLAILSQSIGGNRQELLTIAHRMTAAKRRGVTAKDFIDANDRLTRVMVNILNLATYIEAYLPDEAYSDPAFKEAMDALKQSTWVKKARAKAESARQKPRSNSNDSASSE